MRKVVIESPLSGDFVRNMQYARLAGLDCIRRGEAPYASHLIMTQFLNDCDPTDREIGILAGFAWGACADLIVVYTDLGISSGMLRGIENGTKNGKEIQYRQLPIDLLNKLGDKLNKTQVWNNYD